ncbi:hypothetical protein PIB30_022972, partial [Stylosanthes scabra]|nr:hypothetical protein [Stylosanthes scabra]
LISNAPRVEMLVWFVLTSGMKTKDVLLRRNIITRGEESTIRCKIDILLEATLQREKDV